MNDLKTTLENLIPDDLDDIVRVNRHLCAIRLSTSEEVASLKKSLIAFIGEEPKDAFMEWRIICLDRHLAIGGPMHVLLGFAKRRKYLVTSPIVAIGDGYAVTESGSLYKLVGEHHSDEPPAIHLVTLCAGLRSWGWGPDLGIPNFFF